MKQSLNKIGIVANMLKRNNKKLKLTYTQLTPPRLKEDRLALLEKAMNMKEKGDITNFHFIMIRGKLMIKTTCKKDTNILSIDDCEKEQVQT